MSRIKPLVWEKENYWWWTARTPFGELFIKRGSDGIYQLSHYQGNRDKKIGWSDNFDEIKEEAEKYWQAKVKECLQDD